MPRRSKRRPAPSARVYSALRSEEERRNPTGCRLRRQGSPDHDDGRDSTNPQEGGGTHFEPPLSRSASEGPSETQRDRSREATSEVGGDDIDSGRPAKLVRLSPEKEHASSALEHMLETGTEMNNADELDQSRSDDSFRSAAGPPIAEHQSTPVQDEEINDTISEVAKETVEAEMLNQSLLVTPPVKIKRPKGWHLRKENRHLRQAVLQGSPARSERQESIDTQDTNGYEPAAILRRLPGRRRVPHTDPAIEADMRRQLELKIAYRAVVKALKPVAIELADRTERELERTPDLHKAYPEYDHIVAEIDRRFEQRMACLESRAQEEEARLEREYHACREICERRYELEAEDHFDDAVAKCQHHYMSILRESKQVVDEAATDDEDGIIPRPYVCDREIGERVPLEAKYDSRCRWYLENDRLWENLGDQRAMLKAQLREDAGTIQPHPKGFVVYDGQRRQDALAHLNLLTLLDAGARTIKNADAMGLQALATAMEISLWPQDNTSVSQNGSAPMYNSAHPAATVYTHAPQPPSQAVESKGKESKPVLHPSLDEQRPLLKQEEGTSDTPAIPQQAPTSRADKPTLEIVGSIPGLENYRTDTSERHRHHGLVRHGEEHKPRRKALTFDIIMHQPEAPSSDHATKHSASTSQSNRTLLHDESAQAESDPKERRRPGPRAVYATNEATQHPPHPRPDEHQAQPWRPFDNNMGPPQTHQPAYVRDLGYPPHPMGTPSQSYGRPPRSSHSSSVLVGQYGHEAPHPQTTRSADRHGQNTWVHSREQPPTARYYDPLGKGYERRPGSRGSGEFTDSSRATHSHPATPIANARPMYQVEPQYVPSFTQPPSARAPPVSANAHASQSLSRPTTPADRYNPTRDGRPSYQPVYALPPQSLPRHTRGMEHVYIDSDRRVEPLRTPPARSPAPMSSGFAYPGQPWEQSSDVLSRFRAAVDSRHFDKHRASDAQVYPHSGPPPSTAPPPPEHQVARQETMQRHPGQKIGQQLLPSTLDPNRSIQSAVLPPQAPHHRRQRSSTGSARSWNPTATPQQAPVGSHQRHGSRYHSHPQYPPPHPPAPPSWQHPEGPTWPGPEARSGPPPPPAHRTVAPSPTQRHVDAGGYPPYPPVSEQATPPHSQEIPRSWLGAGKRREGSKGS